MKASIIGGNGQFGQFFSRLLQEKDVNPTIIAKENYTDIKKDLLDSDIIILAIPLSESKKVYSDITGLIKKDALVIDISSAMTPNLKLLESLKCSCAFLHPLFAPTIRELRGAKYVLATIRKNKNLDWFISILRSKGSIVLNSTPDKHDLLLAYLQALPHFNSILLAKTLADSGISPQELDEFSTSFFRLQFDAISRIFSQNSEIYASIQFQNELFSKALEQYTSNFEELRKIVSKKDYSAFAKLFEKVIQSFNKSIKTSFDESQDILKSLPSNRIKVGYLGPSGSFSEKAALEFNQDASFTLFDSISEVLRAVDMGQIEFGIVPIENSIDGKIAEVMDNLYKRNLFITKAIIVPINQCAAALSRDVKPEIILSKKEALAQCSDYINKEFPAAKLIPTESTSQAFKRIAEESLLNAVAIGPEIAGEKYGLKIIKKNIQNNNENQTRFIVVSKKLELNRHGNITSLVICPKMDKPGLLFNILKHFKENNINLCSIESRPSKIKLGTYVFHIDITGDYSEENIKKAIKSIENENEVIFLGSYDQVISK